MYDNWLLNDLIPECHEFLADRVLMKDIAAGEVLFEPNAPILNIIFPIDGIVSMQSQTADGQTVENFSMGRDGGIGVYYMLGLKRLPSFAVTVISGRACWIPISTLEEAAARFPCVRPALSACMVRVFRRMAQGVVCASCHSASQRIATWLLHADDRLNRSKFDLTQRAFSSILGLRASTISEAYNSLISTGSIQHSRGNLEILNRDILKSHACECYNEVCLEKLTQLSIS